MEDVKACAVKRTLKTILIYGGSIVLAIAVGTWLVICNPAMILVLLLLALVLALIGVIIWGLYEIIKHIYEEHLSDCVHECRMRKQKEGGLRRF